MTTDHAQPDQWPHPTQKTGALLHSRLRTDWFPLNDNGWEWVLLEPMVVRFKDMVFRVARGFRLDFASIRYRAINAIIPRVDRRVTMAALIHDWLYSVGRGDIPAWVADKRLWADQIFYKLLRAAGANVVRSRMAYRAVRMFGGHVWRD